jgi:hypothetical protein
MQAIRNASQLGFPVRLPFPRHRVGGTPLVILRAEDLKQLQAKRLDPAQHTEERRLIR